MESNTELEPMNQCKKMIKNEAKRLRPTTFDLAKLEEQ